MDRVLSEVGQWIIDKKTDKNQLYDEELMYLSEHYDNICLKNNVLYIRLSTNTEFDTLFGNPYKILVPLTLRKEIIQSAHSTKHTGHFKLQSTFHRLSASFHWRSMKSDVI